MSTGWEKNILKEGKGETPEKGKTVTVHCTGYGKNGDLSQKFWSTKDPGQKKFQFKIGLGQVITAWDAGVMTMKMGERAEITASPECAYGSGGFKAWGILPNSTLKFDIELLPNQVRASHILVKHKNSRRLASWKDEHGLEIKQRTVEEAKATLSKFLSEIKASSNKAETFAKIAKTQSDCSSGPRNSGDLNWFGPGQMMIEFEDATYGLGIGEISGIVDTASGSHILLRTG